MSHFSNNPFGGLDEPTPAKKAQGGSSSNKKKRKKNKKKGGAAAQGVPASSDGDWATVGRKGKKDSGAGMGGSHGASNGASNGASGGAAYTPRFSLDDMSTAAEVLAYLDETSSTTKIFYRLQLWRVWTKLLAGGSGKEQLFRDGGREVTFRALFLRSRAIEQTVESVLREPVESEDEELADLFTQCLTGTAAFHNKLVKHLRAVAVALPRNSDGAAVVSSSVVQGVASVVGSFKQPVQAAGQVEARVAELNASIKQRKNQLKHVRDNHADKLAVLREKAMHSNAVLELEEARVEALQAAASNASSGDDAAAARANAEALFAQLQSSVDTLVAAGGKKSGGGGGGGASADELQKRLAGAASKRDRELQSLRTSIGELSGEEERLVARKKQLEGELEKVRSKLNEIGGRRERLMVQEQQVKGTYLHEATQLEAQMAQSGGVSVGVNKAGMTSSVSALVKCMRDASDKTSSAKPKAVGVSKGDVDRYESAAEKHLALEQERLQLLVRVVGVHSSRLSKLRGERDDMQGLGLSDMVDGLNDDIAKVAAKEEEAASTVADIKANVARVKAALASLFPAGGAHAAPKRLVSKLAEVDTLMADVDAAVAKAAAASAGAGVVPSKAKKAKGGKGGKGKGATQGKKKQQQQQQQQQQYAAAAEPVSVAASDLYDSSSSYVVNADAAALEAKKKPVADEWEKVSHAKKKTGGDDGLTEEERIRMAEVMELKARRKREKEEQMERAEAERAAARRQAQEARQRALAQLAEKRAKESEKPWSKAGAGASAAAAVDDGAFPTAEASKGMPTPERGPMPLSGGAAVRAPSKSKKPIRSIAPKPIVQSEPLSTGSVGGASRFAWKVKDISAFSTKEEKDEIVSSFTAIQIVSKDGTVAATVEPSKPAKKEEEAVVEEAGEEAGEEEKAAAASEYLANDSSAPFEDGGAGMEIGDLF